MSHTIKVWERIIEARLRDNVEIRKQQYGFMPGKGTIRCHVCHKNVDGKVQESSKRATLCIRGPRESLRQGSMGRAVVLYEKIRNNGKVYGTSTGYVGYKEGETGVRCAIGTTKSFKVKVGLYQGSALSPFMFAVIMDRLTDEVRREPPWKMLFADDIVI